MVPIKDVADTFVCTKMFSPAAIGVISTFAFKDIKNSKGLSSSFSESEQHDNPSREH